MDTSDRFDSNLPVPFSTALSSPSGLAPAFSGDLAVTPAPQVNSRVLLRGLIRYSGWILLVWLVGAVVAGGLIYWFIGPTYEAFSILRVEPVQPKLFEYEQELADSRSVGPYLQTQVKLITSNHVLEPVVAANVLVAELPEIKDSEDPKAYLREQMVVEIVEGAYLIKVALELADAKHAKTIVNAVVDSYLKYNAEYMRSGNATLKKSLTAEFEKTQKELEVTSRALQALHDKGNVEPVKPPLNLSAPTSDEDPAQPTFSQLKEERFQTIVEQMVRTDLELIAAQAALEVRRRARRGKKRARLATRR